MKLLVLPFLVVCGILGCGAADRYPCDEPSSSYIGSAAQDPVDDRHPYISPDCTSDTSSKPSK